MSDSKPESTWSIRISAEEIQEISHRLRWGLADEELVSFGHVQLECDGHRRTWVASDGSMVLVMRTNGNPPSVGANCALSTKVLVHSRLFRGFDVADAVLKVVSYGKYRELELISDRLTTRIVEPPEKFPNWREMFDNVDGPTVRICPRQFREAAIRAGSTPLGVSNDDPMHTWVHGTEGVIRFHTPWVEYLPTEVDVRADTEVPDTPPALIDVRRLHGAIHLVDDVIGEISLTLPSTPMTPLRLKAAEFDAVVMPTDRWIDDRNKLEGCLSEILSVDEVRPDEDGDYPITDPATSVWARLNTKDGVATAHVFAVVATGVPSSDQLFEEVNSINQGERLAKLVWTGKTLMAEAHVLVSQLNPYHLNYVVRSVSNVADRYQSMLSAFFSDPQQQERLF